MQKAMEMMNIKLVHVISDILGKSGIAIIEAILQGERDAGRLASLADPRCKASLQTIEKSLAANWNEDLIFMLQQSYHCYLFYKQQMRECDRKMEDIAKEYLAHVHSSAVVLENLRSQKKNRHRNAITFDVEAYAFGLWGVNLMRVPGINDVTALSLMGELGHNFTHRFDTYKQFCCWCNVAPNNKISGGKILSSKVPKRKNAVGILLRTVANNLRASKSPLGFFFRRIQSRSGYMSAVVATANKLARIIYVMVKEKREFDESYINLNEEEILRKRLLATQKTLEKIQEKMKKIA
jgi:hypothetical protein